MVWCFSFQWEWVPKTDEPNEEPRFSGGQTSSPGFATEVAFGPLEAVKMQLECAEDDLKLQANPQDDFMQAVHVWQADLKQVQQVMEERICRKWGGKLLLDESGLR